VEREPDLLYVLLNLWVGRRLRFRGKPKDEVVVAQRDITKLGFPSSQGLHVCVHLIWILAESPNLQRKTTYVLALRRGHDGAAGRGLGSCMFARTAQETVQQAGGCKLDGEDFGWCAGDYPILSWNRDIEKENIMTKHRQRMLIKRCYALSWLSWC
jgi:hypothetical protein